MPFKRWPGARRRFSATPRRSWRRRGVGTREARLQVAQTYQQEAITSDLTSIETPGFVIQALTPWENAVDGGFDRSWEIRGILWDARMYFLQHTLVQGGVITQGQYVTPDFAAMYTPCAGALYVDGRMPTSGGPRSAGAYSPFVTTPPIGNPGAVPNDEDVFPTRVLRQNVGLVRSGVQTSLASTGVNAYAIPFANWHWSGRLRKRVSVASRQGLYLGFYLATPLGDIIETVSEISVVVEYQVKYWYRLVR